MKFKLLILMLMSLSVVSVSAAKDNPVSSLSGDYDRDGKKDYFTYTNSDTVISITYVGSTLKKKRTYTKQQFDACGPIGLYNVDNPAQVAMDGSCASRTGQIFIDIYQWNPQISDWCLYREVTGEKIDGRSESSVPDLQIGRVAGCSLIGDESTRQYLTEDQQRDEVAQFLSNFQRERSVKDSLEAFISTSSIYDADEIAQNLTAGNVTDANDFAFFMSSKGKDHDVINLLRRIVMFFPDRVVAKLNLADAYWNDDAHSEAADMYKKYYDQMLKMNKLKLLPERVSKRMRYKIESQ